jgi:hypothetical protein
MFHFCLMLTGKKDKNQAKPSRTADTRKLQRFTISTETRLGRLGAGRDRFRTILRPRSNRLLALPLPRHNLIGNRSKGNRSKTPAAGNRNSRRATILRLRNSSRLQTTAGEIDN